jgi:hypothetical protein
MARDNNASLTRTLQSTKFSFVTRMIIMIVVIIVIIIIIITIIIIIVITMWLKF